MADIKRFGHKYPVDEVREPMSGHRYEDDYYAWRREQADFLRAGRLADLDKEHLIEELDNLDARVYREITSRMAIFIQHLIKWE